MTDDLLRRLDTMGAALPTAASAANEIRRLNAELEGAREALGRLVKAEALKGVRGLVAGWNGEGREGGPFEHHPPRLGATLPKTNCGAVYELDEALEAARAALGRISGEGEALAAPEPLVTIEGIRAELEAMIRFHEGADTEAEAQYVQGLKAALDVLPAKGSAR